MDSVEIAHLAVCLGIEIDAKNDSPRENLLSAIGTELRDLQVISDNDDQNKRHERQVALLSARDEILGTAQGAATSSTALVPVSLMSQVLDILQKDKAKEPVIPPSRPDPTLTMRTNVKATATQASSDFTKARSLPFAGAGALIIGAYGLRTYFNVGDLALPSELFYPFFGAAVIFIVFGYLVATLAQKRAGLMLRRLYNPDVQEEALEQITEESTDYFGSHSQRRVEMDAPSESAHWATEDGAGIIINRSMYGYALRDVARRHHSSSLMSLLSTIDLARAADDATGLALDRLCDLKIIEPVVHQRRQGFRIISVPPNNHGD